MTTRITLALLFIVAAGLSYPWPSSRDRWVLGIAVAAVVILFAWWRGAFLTTMVARRFAVWRRNRSGGVRAPAAGSRTTALLRVEPESASRHPPLPVITGYLDRYGLRADSVRITTRDAGTGRTTWIGLTIDAADNPVDNGPIKPVAESSQLFGRFDEQGIVQLVHIVFVEQCGVDAGQAVGQSGGCR